MQYLIIYGPCLYICIVMLSWAKPNSDTSDFSPIAQKIGGRVGGGVTKAPPKVIMKKYQESRD